MSEKSAIVSVNDIFGIGRLADSKAAERLIDAITIGTGRVLGPWLLKREFRTQLELKKLAETEFAVSYSTEVHLAERSTIRLLEDRLSRQQNRENISRLAIEDLKHQGSFDEVNAEEIEKDWLSYFWEKAETVSDERMQEIWGRLLSRTAAGKRYSARSLDILRTLSSEEARIIERLAAFAVSIGPDVPYWRNTIGIFTSIEIKMPSDKVTVPKRIKVFRDRVVDSDSELQKADLRHIVGNTFGNIFGPLGLYVESGFAHTFQINWGKTPLPMSIGATKCEILNTPGGEDDGMGLIVFGSGIGFSEVGWEIFSLANVPPDRDYFSEISFQIHSKGMVLEPINLD